MRDLSGQTDAPPSPTKRNGPDEPIYVGDARLQANAEPVAGAFVDVEGEAYYRIAHYDRMRPFFMSIVSDADHWMFISSNGALTAGRQNPDHALFPYYTDDKIHDAQDGTGSKTLILARRQGRTFLWEPFSERYRGVYALQRNLYKGVYGNKILFEEVNQDLGLTFSYEWGNSERFGFVKRSVIHNHGAVPVVLRVLDGVQNLLPYGVDRALQAERSTLVDAYKKNELEPAAGLGLFLLSAMLVDKPEPGEALKATTVWATGLDVDTYLVSARQLDAFRAGLPLRQEEDVRAERGAYFVQASLELAPDARRVGYLVADVDQGPDDVVALTTLLADPAGIRAALEQDVQAGTERLKRLVGSADGLQCTEDRMTTARHYANALFNVMRGGVFDDNHTVDRADLVAFVRQYNRPVARRQEALLRALPARVQVDALLKAAEAGGAQLERLCYEYLPLTFSRRHGDPSRPWNTFSIDTRHEDGSPRRSYQGNWRDIFQNWEALGISFPGFLESMIAKFVNASTADGYNPYRITRDGIDWEVIDPADPWSYIGYWGDHQIIYLLKLLELSRAHHPGRLEQFLSRRLFAYANVPYRIKPYQALLDDPHHTIQYDEALAARIDERVAAVGADGKLRWQDDDVYLVTLAEKLLVTMLAKLTNFIPEGGIWMNTQRPEWNDANNALVGYGVSMVTLYYLRRFVRFAADLFGALQEEAVALSEEVADLLAASAEALDRYKPLLRQAMTDERRKEVLDALGEAGSAYRTRLYEHGFSGSTRVVRGADVQALCAVALDFMDHTIRANQRADRLFHAYNLMSVVKDGKGIAMRPLYEMLEGQVAVLSAGVLSGEASLEVLAALKASALYREDQNSYLLYPDRRLPRFVEKNNIPPEAVDRSPLLQQLVAAGDRQLVVRDARGGYHFNGTFKNKDSVQAALDRLSERGYAEAVAQERAQVLDLFEALFDHRSYTGRSGTFFGYEGLGSIYWHMVSKLVLAIQETFVRVHDGGADASVLGRLVEYYYDVRAGIGLNKTPDVYGAFPMDPYSHTPGHAGARQPGMTGQVKEDLICRWGELGVRVEDGRITFAPLLLRKSEFLSQPAVFRYYDVGGQAQTLRLAPGTLAFTYCQVPVVYRLAPRPHITITHRDGTVVEVEGQTLGPAESAQVFSRRGDLRALEVALMPAL